MSIALDKTAEVFNTWGDVIKVLETVTIADPNALSKLNPSLTCQQVYDILWAGIKDKNRDERIDWNSRQSLGAINVWKEYLKKR
jgi:hypothetical protein